MAEHRQTSATPSSANESDEESLPPLPANWTKCFSKTRQLNYYYNPTTSESVWTIEEVLLIESGRKANENKRRSSSNTSATSPHASFSSLKPRKSDDKTDTTETSSTPSKPSTSTTRVKRVSATTVKKALLNIPETAKTTPNELTESLKKKLHIRKAKTAAESLVAKTISKATTSSSSVSSSSSSKKSSIPIAINKQSKKDSTASSKKNSSESNIISSTPTKPPSSLLTNEQNRRDKVPESSKGEVKTPSQPKSSPQSNTSEALTNDMDVIELEQSNLLTDDEDSECHASPRINFESMDIDVIENINEIRKNPPSTATDSSSLKVNERRISDQMSSSAAKHKLFIVIDTNILITNLNDVKEMIDKRLDDTQKSQSSNNEFIIVFVIPWVVVQELDALKNRYKAAATSNQENANLLSNQARHANRLLNVYLSKKCELVRFQTSSENQEPSSEIKCTSNDDYILKCAVKTKQKINDINSSKVILLTNDKNLQTKALITNINVCSFAKLSEEINKMKSQNLPVVTSTVKTEATHSTQVNETQVQAQASPQQQQQQSFQLNERVYELNDQLMSTTIATSIHQVVAPNQIQMQMPRNSNELMELLLDKLFDFMQIETNATILRTFSLIYKFEMIQAYDHLWLDLVLVKPPWDMKALIKNINKNYDALFGFTISSEARQHWRNIVEYLSNTQIVILPNKVENICEKLKNNLKIITEATSFLNFIDSKRYSNDNLMSLVNYLHLLGTYSLRIFKTFSFFSVHLNTIKVQQTSSLVDQIQNCFQVFDQIWKQYFELCTKLNQLNISESDMRHVCFFSQFYSIILTVLKHSYEYCLNYSSEENLLQITIIIFLLYYQFGLKSFESASNLEAELINDFFLVRASISKCFLSLNHSEMMRNGLNQLNEFVQTLINFESNQQPILISNLIAKDSSI